MQVSKVATSAFDLETATADKKSDFLINPTEFFGVVGQQHYRLLSYLVSQLPAGSTVIDIGTHMGSSALALSVNPAVSVYSFDIQRKVPLRDLPNVRFEVADLWEPSVRAHWQNIVLGSAVILLDIDPHHGTMEYEFYKWLKESNYKGLLICDDIWYFKGMRDNFWFKIPSEEKLDITAIGHWSGTGVISFAPRPDIQWETFTGLKTVGTGVSDSPWTVVTAYFDLTKMPDATPAIKARSQPYYMENARATMALDQNLVVYCEEDSLQQLKAMRPPHLLSKTVFHAVDFETLPMTQYRETIRQNRINHPYRGDERNTPSYYLLCMARYGLLKRVMDENPFSSTHFSWLNICIERMGYMNLVHLDDVFSRENPRDLISTIYIDYIAKDMLTPVETYYDYGRCSLCSGFFTGSIKNLYDFCNRIEEKFLKYLALGYGHADEQLYSPVYFEAPHLFQLYYGDYQQMITNYNGCYENVRMPLHYVIPKSFAAKDWLTCANACAWVWSSIQAKTCSLTAEEERTLLNRWAGAAIGVGGNALELMKSSGGWSALAS
jgi:Bacterial protein of unknown function (HtrL_YibB)